MTLKRGFDVAVASVGLILLSPLIALTALVIRLTGRGPVFHRAGRVGLDGATFTIYKFRTMRVTSDPHAGITIGAEPRITLVGRVLRRLKIDELPQLINVLRGDMSIVGPRPEDPRYVASYSEEHRRVLTVRPGMTSPASVAFRNEEEIIAAHPGDYVTFYRERVLSAKLELDLDYIDRRTFWLDLFVLARTGLALLAPARNAKRSSVRRP